MPLEPDQAPAMLVDFILEAHCAERQGLGDRVERGLGDRNADHAAGAFYGLGFALGA
jgi:hypothetical protein